jgi:hypothetical protein
MIMGVGCVGDTFKVGVGADPEGAIFEDWEYRNRFYGML